MLNKWLASARLKQNHLSASKSGIWQFRNVPIYQFLDVENRVSFEKRLLIILNAIDVEDYDIDLVDNTAYWHFEICWKSQPKKSYYEVACVGSWSVMRPGFEGLIFNYQP